MLPASDFTTHGVIVGMTGSGKTGLGIVLIEEALLSGIPVLDHRPEGRHDQPQADVPRAAPGRLPPMDQRGRRDAGRRSRPTNSPRQQAELWREGLARSGVGTGRIAALRSAADVTIYTPGSRSGVPLNVIGNLGAAAAGRERRVAARESAASCRACSSLVGIEADPLSSREHILLANLVERAWSAGRDLDLAALVGQVQQPAGAQARGLRGRHVLPAEGPPRARAPAQWPAGLAVLRRVDAGRPLDIDRLLHDAGRAARAPRSSPSRTCRTRSASSSSRSCSAKLVTWMRRQSRHHRPARAHVHGRDRSAMRRRPRNLLRSSRS